MDLTEGVHECIACGVGVGIGTSLWRASFEIYSPCLNLTEKTGRKRKCYYFVLVTRFLAYSIPCGCSLSLLLIIPRPVPGLPSVEPLTIAPAATRSGTPHANASKFPNRNPLTRARRRHHKRRLFRGRACRVVPCSRDSTLAPTRHRHRALAVMPWQHDPQRTESVRACQQRQLRQRRRRPRR